MYQSLHFNCLLLLTRDFSVRILGYVLSSVLYRIIYSAEGYVDHNSKVKWKIQICIADYIIHLFSPSAPSGVQIVPAW